MLDTKWILLMKKSDTAETSIPCSDDKPARVVHQRASGLLGFKSGSIMGRDGYGNIVDSVAPVAAGGLKFPVTLRTTTIKIWATHRREGIPGCAQGSLWTLWLFRRNVRSCILLFLIKLARSLSCH